MMDELVIFLSSKFLFSAFLFLLQILTIWVFLKFTEFRSSACFRIMVFIGICDAFQQFINGIVPFLIKIYDIFELCKWLEKFLGSLLQSTYTVIYWLNFMLAINRLGVVIKLYILQDYSNAEKRWEKCIRRTLSVLVALYFVANLALYCSPMLEMYLNREFFVWANNSTAPWTKMANELDRNYTYYGYPMVTMLVYLAIFGIMIWPKKDFVNTDHNGIAANQKASQRRILVQSAVQFLVFLQLPVVNLLGSFDLGLSKLEIVNVVSLMMVLIYSINPIIYLLILPSFRQKFVAEFLAPLVRVLPKKCLFRSTNTVTTLPLRNLTPQPERLFTPTMKKCFGPNQIVVIK